MMDKVIIRLKLFSWFLMLAVVSLVSPKYPARVCDAYAKTLNGENN